MTYTLETTTWDILKDSEFFPEKGCRTVNKIKRWGPESLRTWLARPRQMAISDGVSLILKQIPHKFDEDSLMYLKNYLEMSNG